MSVNENEAVACRLGDFAYVYSDYGSLFKHPMRQVSFAMLSAGDLVVVLSEPYSRGMRMQRVMSHLGVGWILPVHIRPLLNSHGEEPIEDEFGTRFD